MLELGQVVDRCGNGVGLIGLRVLVLLWELCLEELHCGATAALGSGARFGTMGTKVAMDGG